MQRVIMAAMCKTGCTTTKRNGDEGNVNRRKRVETQMMMHYVWNIIFYSLTILTINGTFFLVRTYFARLLLCFVEI